MESAKYAVEVKRTGLFTWTYQVNDGNRPELWGIATIAYGKRRTKQGAVDAAHNSIARDKKRRGWYNEGSTYLVKDEDARS